jgi:hypothetical protein
MLSGIISWIAMNWLININWLSGPALQITLLIFMARNELRSMFPRFFSYILFQTIKTACLFIAFRYFPDNYFYAYWTGNAVSVIFAIAVMDEVLRRLFKQYGSVPLFGATIFRWSCGLLLLLAILGAVSTGETGGDRIVAVVFAFDRSLRLMQVGLFLLLMVLSRILKDFWKQQVFGIALGFGIFASIELILVSIVMWYGDAHGATISLLKSTAYNAVTVLWIGYLKRQPEPVPNVRAIANAPALVLATPEGVSDPETGFMLRVEQAVDRVLSRSDWPRPAARGSQIVARKPNLEEEN